MRANFVAIDWGTTNFRAFLIDGDSGRCLAEKRSSAGLRALSREQFPHYCRRQLAEWQREADAPLAVYLAGMVGARSGWAEAAQLELPLTLASLAEHLLPAPGLDNAWLVPGGKVVTPNHVDVMRGEEVQVFGALAGQKDGLFCLPGSHSKWVMVRDGALHHFTTLVTGELFHAVRFHTLLGEPVPQEDRFDTQGFERGLTASRHPAGVLHALFEARSRHLHDGLGAEQVGSFLSGVLIGGELSAMQESIDAHGGVVLIGSRELSARYRHAMQTWGIAVSEIDSDTATIAGIAMLHTRRA